MWGEFVSVIQHNLLRICHQQYFPCAHMVDIRFKFLLCCRQRKAFVNCRFQIGCQKGLHLLGQLQCLNQILFTNQNWKEPAVKTQLLDPRNFCVNDTVLMRQTRIQQNRAVERRGRSGCRTAESLLACVPRGRRHRTDHLAPCLLPRVEWAKQCWANAAGYAVIFRSKTAAARPLQLLNPEGAWASLFIVF
jgi:hypothetical protein